MPLGMEVGLDPGHILLDVDPVPPKRAQPPIFGPCLLWPNGRPSHQLLSSCTYLQLTVHVCFSVTGFPNFTFTFQSVDCIFFHPVTVNLTYDLDIDLDLDELRC